MLVMGDLALYSKKIRKKADCIKDIHSHIVGSTFVGRDEREEILQVCVCVPIGHTQGRRGFRSRMGTLSTNLK